MNVQYIENNLDRDKGFQIFNQLYEVYGSRKLLLILSFSLNIFFILDIIYQLEILKNISYIGLLCTLGSIYFLGIQYYMKKNKFIKKEEIVYFFDLNNDTLIVNENIYAIKQYYHSKNYLLFLHTGGYLSVCKNKVDAKVLKKYIKQVEKPRTWKDTIFWSIIGLVMYFGIS